MRVFSFFLCVGVALGAIPTQYVKRTGSAPTTSSCHSVRAIPEEIQKLKNLDMTWYAKYTEAYGIPILGSAKVSDQALTRACYTMRYLFAGSQEYRDNIYQAATHVTIMAKSEVMTDVPEQRTWDKSVNKRYRGMSSVLGGTFPTTGAEENLICECKDGDPKSWLEDYFLHEAAHTLHLIGVNPTIPNFEQRVKDAQAAAKKSGVWGHVYGTRDGVRNVHHEYFAEAVQSYFGANLWSNKPNGWHGPINSAEQILKVDPTVYNLIKEAIPCGNAANYIDRCTDAMSGFKKGATQKILMGNSCQEETTELAAPSYPEDNKCTDKDRDYCHILDDFKYCDANAGRVSAGTMAKCCGCTCGCKNCEAGSCALIDKSGASCKAWAGWGECKRNPWWMKRNCQATCTEQKFPGCK